MPLPSLRARAFAPLALVLCAFIALNGCNSESSQASALDSQSPSPAQNVTDSEKSLEGIIAFDAPTITRGENDLLLLIFGAKHCRSCEQLLSGFSANPTLQAALSTDMKSYYIHADREESITIITPRLDSQAASNSESRSKSSSDATSESRSKSSPESSSESTPTPAPSPHHAHPSYKTSELVALYGVRGTPLLVFLSPSGKKLLAYPGYISPERLLLTLEFLKTPSHWDKSERDIAQELMKLYQDSQLSH